MQKSTTFKHCTYQATVHGALVHGCETARLGLSRLCMNTGRVSLFPSCGNWDPSLSSIIQQWDPPPYISGSPAPGGDYAGV